MSQENKEIVLGQTPPRILARNKYGLLTDIDYVFDSDGFINYRKMLKPEHLAPNKAKTTEEDVTKIADSDLIILLSGINYLASLRGFKSVTYKTMAAHPSYVAVQCSIKWTPNYETLGEEITFEGQADASKENTDGISSLFLTAIAENRAFARAVRRFLKINIVSQEELQNEANPQAEPQKDMSSDPYPQLTDIMTKAGVTLGQIKEKLTKEGNEEASTWEDVKDIPKPIIFELIGRIKKRMQEAAQKKAS